MPRGQPDPDHGENRHCAGDQGKRRASRLEARTIVLETPTEVVGQAEEQSRYDLERQPGGARAGLLALPQIGFDFSPPRVSNRFRQSPGVDPGPETNKTDSGQKKWRPHARAIRLRPRTRRVDSTEDAAARAAATPARVSIYSRRPGLASSAAICGSSQRLSSSPICSRRPNARYRVPYAVRSLRSAPSARCLAI
jgi:hypothetical protein